MAWRRATWELLPNGPRVSVWGAEKVSEIKKKNPVAQQRQYNHAAQLDTLKRLKWQI